MLLTVSERGRYVSTLRHVHVRLMEILAAWVPTTPEMEVKLLFGEHIWDVAQHADALGKRAFELRLPLQHSIPPTERYAALLAEVSELGATSERLGAMYDVLLSGISRRYARYLQETDSLADAPTVRILDRHQADCGRMIECARALREEFPALASKGSSRIQSLVECETSMASIVAPSAAAVGA